MAIPAVIKEAKDASYRVHRRIRVRPQSLEVGEAIAQATGVDPVVGRILAARGFAPGKELDNFLSPTLKDGLPAPSELKNLDKACRAIADCHRSGKAVAICCDFDVDGLSGGSVVHSFFNEAGIKSQSTVIFHFSVSFGANMIEPAPDPQEPDV
jgi:single-stranded-DNA-specific exonuclease